MQEVQEVRARQPRPTTPADLHRLAALAHVRGLQLTQEQPTVWFCSSASDPGRRYDLTAYSCTCRGFMEHQRCSHYALLLDHLGWLPEVETEDAPASDPCLWCQGSGRIPNDDAQRYDICNACGGSGQRSALDLALAA